MARRRHVDNAGARLAAEVNDYRSANDFLGSLVQRKIANNTYIVSTGDDNISGRLHNTNIITWYTTGDIQINSGRYRTVTTKARLNAFLEGTPWSIAAKRGEWFVHDSRSGEKQEFYDEMFLTHTHHNPARPSSRGGPPGKRPPSRHAHTVPIKGYSVGRHSRRRPLEYARNPIGHHHDPEGGHHKHLELAVSGVLGIHAPKEFIARYGSNLRGASQDDIAIVADGPYAEHYWEAWNDIVNDASVGDAGWRIAEDAGDIFLIHPDAPVSVWDSFG